MNPRDVVEAIASASGVEPIVVPLRGGGWQLWRGGRKVEVGLEVLLSGLDDYRRHRKSVSVDGNRYGLDGAAEAVRIGLVGGTADGDEWEPSQVVEVFEVKRDDLRALLAHAPAELRERYAHALDDRETPEGA